MLNELAVSCTPAGGTSAPFSQLDPCDFLSTLCLLSSNYTWEKWEAIIKLLMQLTHWFMHIELKNLRPQLYSAAEYCKTSYLLINAEDHLGTVAYKLTDLLEQQTSDVSNSELKVTCLNQFVVFPGSNKCSKLLEVPTGAPYTCKYCLHEGITFKFDVSDRSGSMNFTAFTEECKKLFRLLTVEIFEKVSVVLPGDTRFGTIARDLSANHFLIHELPYQGTSLQVPKEEREIKIQQGTMGAK
uniref:Uncharacterized protein n=1 Tax=Chenopodium quinoa TaxID=63459 RepID=A0A803KUN5_CHEQI